MINAEVWQILQSINEDIPNDCSDLLGEGWIDSFDIADIIAALEEHFSVKFATKEIRPENFRDVNSISNLVNLHLKQ